MPLARACRTDSASSRWKVVCTVVSVIPYMLTRTGPRSPCRSYHGRNDAKSSRSPPKMTRRRAVGGSVSPSAASAAISWANAEGVWQSTVAPVRAAVSSTSRGDRLSSWVSTTSLPPCSSAPQISQTEKSKDAEWNSSQVSCGPKSNHFSVA
ncbi:hypothetical protein GCM10010527_52990 [Streptomyces drozdowiczii]